MNKYFIPLIAFLLLVSFLTIGLGLNPKKVPSPLIGKTAPAFSLPRLSDTQKTISPSDYKGQVWMFNVWASWCSACRQEHPLLLKLAKQKLLPIIGLDYKDTSKKAAQWLQDFGHPYDAVAVDSQGLTGIDYGVYGVPETFIMDKTGKVVYKHIGPITQTALDKKILPLIKGLQAQ